MNEGRQYTIVPGKSEAGLKMTTVPTPGPGPGEVVIEMKAWSLNFRDLMMIDGLYPGGSVQPVVPLSDGAGIVSKVGDGCHKFAPGDRVCPIFMPSWTSGEMVDQDAMSALGGAADGTLRDFGIFPESALVRIPDCLSFAEAATMPCAGVTAWNALYGASPIEPGATVLALGTGGVAIWTMQLAHAAGARIVLTSSSDDKIERVRTMGASQGVNYAKDANWGTAARAHAGPAGFDKIVDSAGPATMSQTLSALRRGGELVMVGVLAPGEIDPTAILIGGARVRGVMVGSREQFEHLARAVQTNDIHPVIDRSFGFEDAAEAYRYLRTQKHIGKVVITNDR